MFFKYLCRSRQILQFLCSTVVALIVASALISVAAQGANAKGESTQSVVGTSPEVYLSNQFSACLQISENKTTVGAKVVTGSCSIPVVKKPSSLKGVWYMGVRGSSNNCVVAGNAVDGFDLSVNDCKLGYGLWQESFGALRLWNTSFCLDFENGVNRMGVPVQIWSCKTDQNLRPIVAQSWTVKSSEPIAKFPTTTMPLNKGPNLDIAPIVSPEPDTVNKCNSKSTGRVASLWVERVSAGPFKPSNLNYTYVGFRKETTKVTIQVIADGQPKKGNNWKPIMRCGRQWNSRFFYDQAKSETFQLCKGLRCYWNLDGQIKKIDDKSIGLYLTEFDKNNQVIAHYLNVSIYERYGSVWNQVKMGFCKTAGVGMPLAVFTLSLSKTALDVISYVNPKADVGLFVLEAVQVGLQADNDGNLPTTGRLRGFENLTEGEVKSRIKSMSSEYAKNEVLSDFFGKSLTAKAITRAGNAWDVAISGRATVDSAIETVRTLQKWSTTAKEWNDNSQVCQY